MADKCVVQPADGDWEFLIRRGQSNHVARNNLKNRVFNVRTVKYSISYSIDMQAVYILAYASLIQIQFRSLYRSALSLICTYISRGSLDEMLDMRGII